MALAVTALAGPRLLSSNDADAKEAATHVVEIKDFIFSPKQLSVTPGDRITWINRDIVPHTATASDKSWDSGTLKTDEEWQTTVEAGMYGDYFCRFHPNMKAKLEIRQT
ncbi:cupredoxin family copper-binding protein [Pelagibius sp. Alg239-R121]|uniref:cupredoxin domain-containing protein n=1 Tax=Pelagibius sp. Alg239-R121 TaxID=2993448 RepID=UPI0024A69E45|nr:cupredoxin family copper-binding protein [Pelagibius sp. Alg239-R121]